MRLCLYCLQQDLQWVSKAGAGYLSLTIKSLGLTRITKWLKMQRLIKLARVIKLPTIVFQLEGRLQSENALIFVRLVKMVMVLALVVHYLCAGWYAVGSWDRYGWVRKQRADNDHWLLAYFASARWTLAQINGETDKTFDRTVFTVNPWVGTMWSRFLGF